MPRYIILIDNNALLLMKTYWSQGWMSCSVLKISQGNHFQSSPGSCIFHNSPPLTPYMTLSKPQNCPGTLFCCQ